MAAEQNPEFLAQYPKNYGPSWRGVTPDFTRCADRVSDGGRMVTMHQCSRKNGYGPHGAWCKQHDPDARKVKDDERRLKWRSEWDAKARDEEFTRAARTAVKLIAQGHNDPRTLCQDILRAHGVPE